MSQNVLEASLDFLAKLPYQLSKVKFFGGEPMLQFDQITAIIEQFPQKNASFYMTTNGSLLTEETIKKLQELHIITTVSLDGTRAVTSENRLLVSGAPSDIQFNRILQTIGENAAFFRVNQVITPKSAKDFWDNFIFLYEQGFRSFNFLPEYYIEWSKDALFVLSQGFKTILQQQITHPIHLVNQENYSPTSFFNLGIVIDTDGSIYGTNLILAWRFEKYKSELKIGSIFDEKFTFPQGSNQMEYLAKIESCLQKEYSENILKSVYYINRILSNFTLAYGK